MKSTEQNWVKSTLLITFTLFVLYFWMTPSSPLLTWVLDEETPMEWKPLNYSYQITPNLLEFVKESEQIYRAYLAKKEAAVAGRDLKTVDPWANPTFWNYFAPAISCPYPISRVGYIGDGGKWICGLSEIARKSYFAPCIIYSFGVGAESSFEFELLSTTNCSVWAFDPTVNGINMDVTKFPGRVHFEKIGLGAKSSSGSAPGIKSLQEIMTQLGHSWIDILKVDVEAAEFAAVDQIVHDFPTGLPFAHLNLEIHLQNVAAEGEGKQFATFWEWWTKLERLGLRSYINEDNHLNNVRSNNAKPRLMEYGFINIQHVLNRLV